MYKPCSNLACKNGFHCQQQSTEHKLWTQEPRDMLISIICCHYDHRCFQYVVNKFERRQERRLVHSWHSTMQHVFDDSTKVWRHSLLSGVQVQSGDSEGIHSSSSRHFSATNCAGRTHISIGDFNQREVIVLSRAKSRHHRRHGSRCKRATSSGLYHR